MTEPNYDLNTLLEDYGVIRSLYPALYDEVWEALEEQELEWSTSSEYEGECYSVDVGSERWYLRVNPAPDGPRFTFCIEDWATLSFDELPETWQLPE